MIHDRRRVVGWPGSGSKWIRFGVRKARGDFMFELCVVAVVVVLPI